MISTETKIKFACILGAVAVTIILLIPAVIMELLAEWGGFAFLAAVICGDCYGQLKKQFFGGKL